MLAGFIRRAASVGVLASPTQPSSTFDDSADGDDAEEAPLPGGVRVFARDGRALGGHTYALPDRGSDRLPPTGATDRPDTPDSVASDSSGRGASAPGLSAATIPPARFGLALPPSDHAFWRTPDAPQQALSVLASVERERAAAQVAQRALTSAAEFLTKKNAKLKADLTAAKMQLQALNGGAAGGAEAAAASRRASEAEQQQLRQRQQHASERAVDSQAVVAAQAEVKALRRRVAGLEDALSDSERRHAKALRAAQEAAQASQASGLASASGTPSRPGSAPGLVAGGTPQAGVRMPSGFMADDVITAGLRDELADANDRIDELEARLEDAAATARAGADAADAAIAAERAKTQAALAALAAASRGEEGASPSGQVAALRAECEQLRGQAAAAQAKCDQLQRRLRGGDVAVRAERVAAQLEATREAEAQVEALRAELTRVRAEQTVSSSPASPSAAQAGDVEEQQRVIDALRAELAATQAALARSRSAARSEGPAPSSREMSDLQAAVAAARATADDASRRCAAAEAALRRERATAAEAVSAERTARLAAEATLRRGTNSSAALGAPTAAAFTALKQRLDAAEASLAEVTRERDAALTELSNASLAEVERLQSEIDDDLASSREAQSLRGRLEALTAQLREAQAVAAEAQERALEAERSLEAHAQASHGESGSSSKAAEEAVSLRAALERERAVSKETEEAMLAEAQAQAQTAAALTSQLEVATAALLDAQAALAREKQLRVEAEAAAVEPAPAAPTVPEAELQQLHAAVQACDAQRQQLLRLEAEFTQLHEAFLELSRRLHQAEAAHAELLAGATAREAALQADVTSLAEEAEAAHVHASAVDSRAAEVQAALEETLEQLAMTRQALAEKPPPGAEAAAVMAARESARASERARYEKQVSQRLEAAHAQWQAERTALQKAAAGADALAEEVVRERAAAEEARAEAAALRRKLAQARDSSDSDADADDDSFADAVDHERGADAGLGNTPDAGAASLAAEEAAALRSALASIASQRATAEVQAAQAAQRASQAEAVILELRQQLDERQEALEVLRARHDDLATAATAEQEAGSASSSPGEDTQAESAVSFLTHEDLDGGQPGDEGPGEPDAALAAFELAAEALQQRMRRACSLPVREWAAATRVM